MSHGWSTFVLWGVFLAILAAITAPFGPDLFTYGMLGASALFIVATGVGLLLLSRREPESTPRRRRLLPELSYSAMLLGIALSTLALGAELGLWLVLIGAGLCVLAIGGLVREWRAESEAAEELRADG